MAGKAKPKKHTAKELQMKLDAQKDRGGGQAGMANRQPIKATFICQICCTILPDRKNLGIHYENKHPKVTFSQDLYPDPPQQN